MSDDLTTLPEPPESVKNYFRRLLLGTPVNILDEDMKVKTFHLLDHELEDLKKIVKEKTGKDLNT